MWGGGRACAEFYLEGDKRDRLQKTTYCMCALPMRLRSSLPRSPPCLPHAHAHAQSGPLCSRRGGTPDALRGISGSCLAPQGSVPHHFHHRLGTIAQVLLLPHLSPSLNIGAVVAAVRRSVPAGICPLPLPLPLSSPSLLHSRALLTFFAGVSSLATPRFWSRCFPAWTPTPVPPSLPLVLSSHWVGGQGR